MQGRGWCSGFSQGNGKSETLIIGTFFVIEVLSCCDFQGVEVSRKSVSPSWSETIPLMLETGRSWCRNPAQQPSHTQPLVLANCKCCCSSFSANWIWVPYKNTTWWWIFFFFGLCFGGVYEKCHFREKKKGFAVLLQSLSGCEALESFHTQNSFFNPICIVNQSSVTIQTVSVLTVNPSFTWYPSLQ